MNAKQKHLHVGEKLGDNCLQFSEKVNNNRGHLYNEVLGLKVKDGGQLKFFFGIMYHS